MSDIQDLFEKTIAEFMEKGMEAEMEEEPGYGKYDYRNKETDNPWNGHSSKALKPSSGMQRLRFRWTGKANLSRIC